MSAENDTPPTAALRIASAVEDITDRLHLLECAIEGRFDTGEARAFKRPIGDIIELTRVIEDAAKEIVR